MKSSNAEVPGSNCSNVVEQRLGVEFGEVARWRPACCEWAGGME